MDINNLMYNPGTLDYYDRAIRDVIDDHMTYLRSHPENEVIAVAPKDVERFQGALYDLFSAMGIPPQYHYCVRQMNQLSSAQEVPEDLSSLLIPNYSVVDTIRQASTALRTL